jgi:hypothetical protein
VEKDDHPEPIVHAVSTYAQTLTGMGRFREALALTERAYDLSRRFSRPADVELTCACSAP